MAEAMIARLPDKKNISASDVSRERLKVLSAKYKIKIGQKIILIAFESADIII